MKFVLAEKNQRDGGAWIFQMGEQWERKNEVEFGVQVCGCNRMKVMKKMSIEKLIIMPDIY